MTGTGIRTFNVKYKKDELEDFLTSLESESLCDSSSGSSPPQDFEADAEPLIVKFKDRKLSVTDFSAQVWCEMKLFKTITTGYREETFAMRAGIERHAVLEQADHDVTEVEVSTREDLVGLKMLSTIIMLNEILPKQKKVREVWLSFYNPITDCVVRGIIDEIVLDPNSAEKKIILKDTKTRRDQTVPSEAQKRTSAIQLQMYLWMLESVKASKGKIDWIEYFRIYQCDPYADFKCEELSAWKNLATLTPIYFEAFLNLPPAQNYALIEYDFEGVIFQVDRVPYSRKVLEFALEQMRLFWWNEKDKPDGVPLHEKWKCKFCPFIQSCPITPLAGQELQRAIRDQEIKNHLSIDLEQIS